MGGDFISQDDEIYKLSTYYNIFLIPFYIIYGTSKTEGLILPLVIKYGDILKTISPVEF